MAKLRWFAEETPELAVVAAGSLLEFALADFAHSMPVGRIRYAHIEPLTFAEFLSAKGQTALLDRLEQYDPGNPPSRHVVDVKTTQSKRVRYLLLDLPHYLTWRLPDLLEGLAP